MRSAVRYGVAISVLALALMASAAPAAAQAEDDGDELIVLTGRAPVAEDETLDFVFIADGPVVVDGTVAGPVVAVNGDVLVRGTVDEDVVAFDGRVVVDGGRVGGDVVSRRRPVVQSGGTIVGSWERWNPTAWRDGIAIAGRIVVWLTFSISTLLLGLLLLLLAPRIAVAANVAFRENLGAAIGWGLVLTIGLPVVAVAAMLTIVALPLGLAVLFALALVYGVGYVVAAVLLGSRVASRTKPLVAFLIGWAILRVAAIVPILGGLVGFAAVVVGLGSVAVAAHRARRGRADAVEAAPYAGAAPA
jgi:hypothetical protein